MAWTPYVDWTEEDEALLDEVLAEVAADPTVRNRPGDASERTDDEARATLRERLKRQRGKPPRLRR